MNHNKLIAVGLILTIGVFLAAGCIGGETPEGEGAGDNVTQELVCGNGVAEGEEKCDGSELRGKTCKDLGYDTGTLKCTNQCTYDTSDCTTLTGTPISTCQELQNIQNNLSGDYYLANDIDCSNTKNWNNGKGFKPIGNKSNKFKGSLNGLGYEITGLYINRGHMKDNYNGLIGYSSSEAKISNISLKDIKIEGGKYTGGLIGYNKGTTSNCYAEGKIKGNNYRIGGLIGHNEGTVSKSHAAGKVEGSAGSVGGLIGMNNNIVSKSYATAEVTGRHDLGGLIGYSHKKSNVSNSYATGKVEGVENDIGGLTGENSGHISNSYATGKPTGDTYVGGLTGKNDKGSYSNSFWDTETSGMTESDGGTGLTTSEMKSKSTYTDADWDFEETWYMDGYPHLQWEK